YQALSYVWGDPSVRLPIRVDGKRFLVTENLFAVLSELQKSADPPTLWIDAICINQEDNVEKAHQVARMNAIYEGSQRVIAWLGPAADQSDLAIQKLQRMAGFWESKGPDTTPEAAREIVRQATAEMVGHGHYVQGLPHIVALRSLFLRPWWERVWIIQEGS
ncbi:heterokaryon incompatibility, partial [Immersiella caudata]